MEKTIVKPSFEETMNLLDVGLRFNAQRVGPTNFRGLREADYGKGFRMPTMPELVPLVYASLENQDHDTAKNVVKTLKRNWITSNTGIFYAPEGMFVQDNPELKDGKILMNQKALESKLGSHRERGVMFSDDRSVRFTPYKFTPYKFKIGSQSALDLARNSGIIALVGGGENAEKLAKASEHYRAEPYFWTFDRVKSPQTRIVGLISGDFFDIDVDFVFGLGIYANDSEYLAGRFSFGVQKIKQEGKTQ